MAPPRRRGKRLRAGEVFEDQRFYDLGIRFVVPKYDEMHEAILSALPFGFDEPFECIDLGIGTGELSTKILRRWPNARVLGVDNSPDMLALAQRKLSGFADRIRFERLNMNRMQRRGPAFDAVVSGLAVHHLTPAQKKRLFRVLHESLAPGGLFVNGDLVKANSPLTRELYQRLWLNHMRGAGLTEQDIERKIVRHGHVDRPDTVEQQLQWMSRAGFAGVECIWRYYDGAVMLGLKSKKR